MGWADICSWTTCLGARKEEIEDIVPPRPISKLSYQEDKKEVSEKKFSTLEKAIHPPPPPPSVVSERPHSHNVTERDLPPVPPVPDTSVYELGFSSPRAGVTRSNSKTSVKTSRSVKSRKHRTQQLEKHTTSPPTGLRQAIGVQSVAQQAVELSSASASHRSSIRQPLIDENNGKMSPFPSISRSSPTPTKTEDELPIACDDEDEEEEEGEYYDDDSLKEMRRRSDSAPIPLRVGLRHSHTIRRKPVTPKASISFSRPTTVQSTVLETYAEQLGTFEGPIEMDAPVTFELSADPKSRTQSYYADPGIVLLAATLDEVPPPLPTQPPSLLVDTDVQQQYAATNSPVSKKLPFSPLTTVSSPVDDMTVSPITPHANKSRDRMTWMKRSKSVGSSSASRQSANLKRRSLNEEPPLPILPPSTYSPPSPKRESPTNSLLKTESTNDSSRRTSNSSEKSRNSSRSSLSSRGPSPSNFKTNVVKRVKKPERELEMLKPIAFQRRSTNAPIPIVSGDEGIPSVPSLPPQSYHFTTPKPQKRSSTGLLRSLSSKNLRTQEPVLKPSNFTRSKSIYYAAPTWNGSSKIPPLPIQSNNKELPSLPQHPTAIPLPDSDTETDGDSDNESEYASVKSGAAELESQDQADQYIEETEPRSVLPTPIERENDPLQERWGKGMGAEWGVAY